jgi:hypothetical protein
MSGAMSPLDELQLLDNQVETAKDVGALRPIYDRLDEIARENSGDFEVQLVAADLRQRVINKGLRLRRARERAVRRPLRATEPPPAPQASKRFSLGDSLRANLLTDLPLSRAVWMGVALGVVGWLVIFVTLVQVARRRNIPQPAAVVASSATKGGVPVDITTSPPGATIQINNETKCKSNCRIALPPGNYQVTAMLDGFEPAATGVTVVPGPPIAVNLMLPSQTQTVRIYTDLPSGKVFLDGRPAPDLLDGQLVLDRVKNGKHRITVSGPNAEATFAFELQPGKPPAITGPVAATNVLAVLVSSFGSDGRVQSSSATPLKVALNGLPQGEAGPAGLELKNVPAGDQQLTIGDGRDQRKMVVQFGPTAALTAFLKSDVSTGTLVVSTGEDGVSVFVNGKEYRRKTRHGELRIPALGAVAVRVAKEGFQSEPEQTVEVKKGEEAKLAFKLRPLPQVASLQIHNAIPGTQVFLDDRSIGRVGDDGSLSAANLAPGDHAIEVRREGYMPRRILRKFIAGQTLALNGNELVMPPAAATVHLAVSPPDAQVTYRRSDEAQTHTARDNPLKLEPGSYVFTAKAPGHTDQTARVPVAAGETRNVALTLPKETAAPPVVKPAPVNTVDWEGQGWERKDGEYVRKGGNRVVVKRGRLNGVITFTAQLKKGGLGLGGLFRGGKLRWFIDDGEQYSQFEIDKKHFYANGDKLPHPELDQRVFTVQIDISPQRIVQRMKTANGWVELASAPGREIANGTFGFVVPGGDEIGISNFHFTPR